MRNDTSIAQQPRYIHRREFFSNIRQIYTILPLARANDRQTGIEIVNRREENVEGECIERKITGDKSWKAGRNDIYTRTHIYIYIYTRTNWNWLVIRGHSDGWPHPDNYRPVINL